MNQTKRWIGFALALLMVFAVVVPAAYAQETSQNVIVHKIVMNETDFKNFEHDENEYDPATGFVGAAIQGYFGASAKEISGVVFDFYKEGNYTGTKPNPGVNPDFRYTTGGPAFTVQPAQFGKYLMVENHALSDYSEADNQLTHMLAVPQEITFPYTNEDGVADTLHLYPKNTEDKPTLIKDFTDVETTVRSKDYTIGDTVPFTVTTTVPAQSKYATFTWEDTMDSGLTFKDDLEITTGVEGLSFVKETDYTVTYTANGFRVELTASGFEKINNRDAELTITLKYSATLNEKAAINAPNVNEIKLTYNNRPNDNSLTLTSEVEVFTGGHKFVKVDKTDTTKTLQGAEFHVTNADGEYLAKVANSELWTWVTSADGAHVFTSGAAGTFEVKGLKYGKYNLIETKAPTGYAKPKDPISFAIKANTYTTTTANPTEVTNIKITIPQTGGIGTVAFGVVGVLLMGGALLGMKRKEDEDEQ